MYGTRLPAEAVANVMPPIPQDVEVACVNCGDYGCEYCSPALAEECGEPPRFEDVFGQG